MNNREIKFRAWDKVEKIMFEVIGFTGMELPLEAPFNYITGYGQLTDRKYAEIMQFTGLKDKNGKEIYEGDILRLHCFNDNLITATVEWDEEQARFFPHIHDKKIIVDGGTSHGKKVDMGTVHSWAGMHSCWSFERYTEIIGNIYENPELIKNDHA
jgi:uncharacterized phage protein (TIGR01671 family)